MRPTFLKPVLIAQYNNIYLLVIKVIIYIVIFFNIFFMSYLIRIKLFFEEFIFFEYFIY